MLLELLERLFGFGRYYGSPRSPKWSVLEKQVIAEHPYCPICLTKGTLTNRLNVHHIQDFHEHPELELSKQNLLVLCRRCHFLFGHLYNWKSINPKVLEDALIWAGKIHSRL
jgi:hypothetical protein